jgi:glycosyltransferase involved in cell wall biosynthesis
MSLPPLKVLQVSSAAQGGGAERIAYGLHIGLKEHSQQSWMAVGQRNREDPDIFAIPTKRGPHETSAANPNLVQRFVRVARSPRQFVNRRRGMESFDFPGTRHILDLPPSRPDIVHCHNLHGGYFDLRQLAPLSRSVPVLMTLHDEWTYTGHCAYTMGIDLWRTGCQSCPDLAVYPAIRGEATHANWLAKRGIYRKSRLYVSTPSQWLMDRARDSILAEGTVSWQVIPNGVDRSVFRRGVRDAARALVGLPLDAVILLFTANQARRSVFKDYATVAEAARIIGTHLPDRNIILVVLGDGGPVERQANVEIRPTAYEARPERVGAYYQAADLYLHAAKADNLPTTVIEAMASGLAVVATAVGGIPEMVKSLAGAPGSWAGAAWNRSEATGVLVDQGDAEAMATAAAMILGDKDLGGVLGTNASSVAATRFDLERQVDSTLAWYRDVLDDWRSNAGKARQGGESA